MFSSHRPICIRGAIKSLLSTLAFFGFFISRDKTLNLVSEDLGLCDQESKEPWTDLLPRCASVSPTVKMGGLSYYFPRGHILMVN